MSTGLDSRRRLQSRWEGEIRAVKQLENNSWAMHGAVCHPVIQGLTERHTSGWDIYLRRTRSGRVGVQPVWKEAQGVGWRS